MVRLLLRYYESAKTSCRPFLRTSFPSLGGTMNVLIFFSLPISLKHCVLGSGACSAGFPSACPAFFHGDCQDLPGSRRTPLCICHVLRPRRDCIHPVAFDVSVLPPPFSQRRLSRYTLISRLNRTASTLAVYASWFCFHLHARLASGCRPDFTGSD